MNKGFLKFIINLVILVLVLWGIFAIAVRRFPMNVLDEEYGAYKQTMDYVHDSNEYNKTLIFGDSVAKAAIKPTLISDSMYNLSMAGATSIEQYFILSEYLKNHEPPKTVVMLYFMGGYNTINNFFWNRTVYFNCLTTSQFNEIYDTGLLPNSASAKFKFFQYKLVMPNRYYAAVKKSIYENRKEANERLYEYNVSTRGQHFFGEAPSYAPNNTSIDDPQHFELLEIIDYYMNRCIDLCEKNNIQVIIEQHPINLSTEVNMKQKFKEEYFDYMTKLKANHPSIIVNKELTVRPDDWFGDFSHLNSNGTTQFTYELNEKYKEYFQ